MKKKHLLAELLLGKADANQLPIDGVFEITPLCNMNCKMCYIHKTQEEVQQCGGLKSIEQWLSLAKQAKEKGLLFLLLTGGEIFTYPNFKTLYKELSKMGFILSLNTNGTIINDYDREYLIKYPPKSINITLYGSSADTYEKLCGYPQGYEKAIDTIIFLKKQGLNVNINVSLTPVNVNDLFHIYNFAKKYDIPCEASSYMFPSVRRKASDSFVRFDPEEAAHYAWDIQQLKMSSTELDEMKKNYNKLVTSRSQKGTNQFLSMQCRAGHSSFWVTWDGKLIPCGMMSYPYAFPFSEGFEISWNKIVKETKRIKLSLKCAQCANRSVCQVCAAKAFAETGKFDGTPSYICALTNEMNNIMNII